MWHYYLKKIFLYIFLMTLLDQRCLNAESFLDTSLFDIGFDTGLGGEGGQTGFGNGEVEKDKRNLVVQHSFNPWLKGLRKSLAGDNKGKQR